ncbi:hypothetical protein K439DRAFT_690510 [Ramaria rubella]|nr:hypothetical protein K439DRAFT_690510 [Ramaria rubella]
MLRARQDPFGPGPVEVPQQSSVSLSNTPPEGSLSINPGSIAIHFSIVAATTGPSDSGISSSAPTFTSPSSTPTSTQGGLEPTPSWIFATPINATTCLPLQLNWFILSPASHQLSMTRINLLVNSASVASDAINLTLATDQSLLSETYTWPAVTIPPGSYVIQSSESDRSGPIIQSSIFSVQAGTNTTCLSSSESGDQDGTSTSSASATSKRPKTAAIAGASAGGVVLLACVGVLLFYQWTVRKRSGKRYSVRRSWRGHRHGDSKSIFLRDTQAKNHDLFDATSNLVLDSKSTAFGRGGSYSSSGYEKSLSQSESFRASPISFDMTPVVSPIRAMDLESLHSSSDCASETFTRILSTNSHRTPRKPVPAYTPTPDEIDAMTTARSWSDQSPQPYLPSTPHRPTITPTQQAPSTTLQHAEALLQGLKTKSSGHFADQPVHYLIPDMPPASPYS